MIEVEKGFILNPEQEKALIKDAEFLGEKEFTDVYYDDENYSLTTNNLWLRQRNGKFELKVPMNKSIEERVSDQYEELESEEEILKYFDAPNGQSIVDFLESKGYKMFCKLATKRRKYKKEGFSIDLDKVDFGYQCAEIELMVDSPDKIESTTNKIIKFAKKHSIEKNDHWGKAIEYIRKNDPAHFKALIDAKVIK